MGFVEGYTTTVVQQGERKGSLLDSRLRQIRQRSRKLEHSMKKA
jgi:hypothetical protein